MGKLNSGRFAHATPFLIFCCFAFSFGDILFGVDTGSFGSLQALPSWLRQFGTLQPNGKYALSSTRKSIINSVVWIGKITGTLLFEPVVEKVGYKKVMYLTCLLQIIGVIVELTAKDWIVFSIGREFAYLAVGFVENAVPSYQAELAPAAMRGMLAGSIMMINTGGNLWGAGMSRAYATETGKIGWMVPVGVQLIPAGALVFLVPFCCESPRWLLLHGKRDEAIKALNCVRPAQDVQDGTTMAEIEALEHLIEEGRHTSGGSWLDLFRGNYRRRTIIASLMFFFQQTTGSQFVNSYGPIFFVSIGLAANSFTYQTLAIMAAVVGCGICIAICDKTGRRPLVIIGTGLTIVFNVVIAACGSKKNPSTNDINAVIASLILLLGSSRFSVGTLSYLMAAEIGGLKMRKKIIGFATAIDVVAAFLITFSFPYLLGDPAYLGAKLGWVMAGLAVLSFIFAIFMVPELKGRSLEEVDELFERKLWAWQFKNAETHGEGRRLAELEGVRTRAADWEAKPDAETLENEAPGSGQEKSRAMDESSDKNERMV